MSDGGRAFPGKYTISTFGFSVDSYNEGMSLRDWYAGMAMQGLLGGSQIQINHANYEKGVSEVAFEVADAMIKEREV